MNNVYERGCPRAFVEGLEYDKNAIISVVFFSGFRCDDEAHCYYLPGSMAII